MAGRDRVSKRETIGVFPASFDPIHMGHVTVAERAARLLDKLIVAIAVNPEKIDKYEFSTDEKVVLARKSLAHIANAQVVDVVAFEGGLTVDHARELGATTMLRGARSNTDFEAEIELHLQNIYAQQARGIEPSDPEFVDTQTFYRLPGEDHMSSSLIRFFMHGPGVQNRAELIRPLVPEPVFEAIVPRLPAEG